jgi:hypothetical protein
VHDEIFESEVVLKKPAFVIGHDSYTPSAMDMCTPFRPQQCVILQIPIKNHTNSKVIHPKYYKHLKKGASQSHLGKQKMGWFLAD